MAEQKNIEFGITDIRLTEFFVDESKRKVPGLNLNYRTDINLEIPQNVLRISIAPTFTDKESSETIMRGKVETVFAIKEMKTYSRVREDGGEIIDFPEHFWVTLFSISFSHTRALLAHSAGRTAFAAILLPVINPTTEFRKLFAQQLQKDSGK
jgi:hypothetical protein